MAKFNLKEHIAKNKATFFGSLTEGQFSWMTQDTGQQIGSEQENTLPFVYMHDDKGNKWLEKNYEGYGEFGGKDYYELLDQMNGGIGDRDEGIRKAFDAPAVANGEIKFPALTVSATLPSGHDFTQEAPTDPNQSWYTPEEDDYYDQNDDDEDYNRYGDEDEEELEEGEAAYEYEKGKEAGEKIEKTKMKKSELKAKIKEMIVAEMDGPAVEDSQYDFLKEIEEMLDEEEGLTPLQDYVYQYEIEISGEDFANEELENIKQLQTPQDVYDYYAVYRGWEQDKDFKNDLKNIYKQVKRKFANLTSADDLTPLQRRAYNYTKERFGNEEAKNSLDQIKTFQTGQEFTDWVHQKLKNLSEADEDTADAEAAADAGAEDTEVTDTEVTTDVTTDEVDPNVKAVQDALTQAQAAAQQLGDKKLMDQIGNTITFFTRSHVVEKPGAVSENLNESMFPMLKKILK